MHDVGSGVVALPDYPAGVLVDGDEGRGLRNVFSMALDTIDSDIKAMPNELDAIETAMAMENKTRDFYVKQGKAAIYDTERDLYMALAAQESEHHKVLLDYFEFLKNPAAWYVQKEHPSLDGG